MKEFKNKDVFRIAVVAIFSALVGVSGLFFAIPISGGSGYFNFSDIFIILVACLIDPISGMFVGIIGGTFIDLFSGYAIYIPFTIVIKGLEGIIVGYCYIEIKKTFARYALIIVSTMFCISLYMIPNFMIDRTTMFVSLPYDLLQAIVNSILAIGLVIALQKRYFKHNKS